MATIPGESKLIKGLRELIEQQAAREGRAVEEVVNDLSKEDRESLLEIVQKNAQKQSQVPAVKAQGPIEMVPGKQAGSFMPSEDKETYLGLAAQLPESERAKMDDVIGAMKDANISPAEATAKMETDVLSKLSKDQAEQARSRWKKIVAASAGAGTVGYGAKKAMEGTPEAGAEQAVPSPPPTSAPGPEKPKSMYEDLASRISKPEDFSSLVSRVEKQLANAKLPPESQKRYEDALARLEAESQEARTLYKEQKERIGWAQVFETLGQALAQLGAGIQGQKTGVDLSGLKFQPTDWSKRYDTALSEFKTSLEDIKERRREVGEMRKGEEKGIQEKSELLNRLYVEGFRQSQQNYRDQLDAINKLRDKDEKEADKLAEALRKKTEANKMNLEKAKGRALDIEEGRVRAKDISKTQKEIRELMIRSGIDAQSFEQAIESAREPGWFESKQVTPLSQYIDAQSSLMDEVGSATSVRQQQSANGKVKVKNPQGQIGYIPTSQLEAAKAQGYQEVK